MCRVSKASFTPLEILSKIICSRGALLVVKHHGDHAIFFFDVTCCEGVRSYPLWRNHWDEWIQNATLNHRRVLGSMSLLGASDFPHRY
jgi:hypothetical protein